MHTQRCHLTRSVVSGHRTNLSHKCTSKPQTVYVFFLASAKANNNASAVASLTGTKLRVHAPATPRIDISRASSSSYHEDSRDSSPENVFEQVSDTLHI